VTNKAGEQDEPDLAAADALLRHGSTGALTLIDGAVVFANDAARRILRNLGIGHFAVDTPLKSLCPELAAVQKDTHTPIEIEIPTASGSSQIRVTVVPGSHDTQRVMLLEELTAFRSMELSLKRRTAVLEATIESLPFDFWMNDTDNRTVLQNSVSRKLWGDKFGVAMEDVQSDPEILKTWNETNIAALSGEIREGEIVYTGQGGARTFRNIVAPVFEGRTIVGIVGLNIDITDLKRALHDRDVLLRELNHRVKNHLQLIVSMINLHRGDARCETEAVLRRIEERVQAIYLVHEQLHNTGSLDYIDLDRYLMQLVEGIRGGYGSFIDISPLGTSHEIELQHATALGVILTELVVNAIKHGQREHPIEITAEKHPGEITVQVTNRIGRNRVTDPPWTNGSAGTGGMVIMEHVAHQLSGSIDHREEDDRHLSIVRFPYHSEDS
jgi:two-component sensor histidine kinase